MKLSTRLYVTATLALTSMLAFVGNALATVDPTLQSAADDITGYFEDNVLVVVGVLIAVSLVLWLIGMAVRSVGANKKKPA